MPPLPPAGLREPLGAGEESAPNLDPGRHRNELGSPRQPRVPGRELHCWAGGDGQHPSEHIRAGLAAFSLCSTSAVPVPGRSDEDPSRRPSPTCGPELKVTAVIPYALSPYLPHSFYFTAFIFWGTLCRTKPSLLCSASARAVLLRPHPSPFSVSSHAELPGRPDRSARTAFPARSRGAAAGPCRAVGPAGGRGRPALSAGLCCAGGAALSLRERWRKAVRVGVLQDFGAPPPSSRSVPAPGERDPKAALPAALREGIGTGKRREGNFGRLRAAEPAV